MKAQGSNSKLKTAGQTKLAVVIAEINVSMVSLHSVWPSLFLEPAFPMFDLKNQAKENKYVYAFRLS